MGTYKFKDGSIYKGEWHKDLMHGKGVYIWPDESMYDGEFVYGKRHGFGKL